MKGPSKEVAFGRLMQARADLGSIRKAAGAVGVPYSSARRLLMKLGQPQSTKKPRKGTLTAEQHRAAFDMLSQASASGVADQLFKEGVVERVLHKSTVIRAAKSHASKMGISLKYSQGLPKKELSPATKQKRLAFAKENAKRNWSLVLFTDRKKFGFKFPGVKVGQGKWLKACKRADDPSSSLRIVPSSASMSVPSISVSWYAARERLKTLDGSFAVTVAVRVDL